MESPKLIVYGDALLMEVYKGKIARDYYARLKICLSDFNDLNDTKTWIEKDIPITRKTYVELKESLDKSPDPSKRKIGICGRLELRIIGR